jgi:hypothetical protein
MSGNKNLISYMKNNIANHEIETNLIKKDIPNKINNYTGSINIKI